MTFDGIGISQEIVLFYFINMLWGQNKKKQ